MAAVQLQICRFRARLPSSALGLSAAPKSRLSLFKNEPKAGDLFRLQLLIAMKRLPLPRLFLSGRRSLDKSKPFPLKLL